MALSLESLNVFHTDGVLQLSSERKISSIWLDKSDGIDLASDAVNGEPLK